MCCQGNNNFKKSAVKLEKLNSIENHHAMYTHLVLTEKLWKHLEEVDMDCNDMMDMLTVRMAEREGVTEHLKSVDQLGWVRKMNNIRSRAEEVVLHDLIYR